MLLEYELLFVLKLPLLLFNLFLTIKLGEILLFLFYYLLGLNLLLISNAIQLRLLEPILNIFQLFFMVIYFDFLLRSELLLFFVISQRNIKLIIFLDIFVVF